MHQCNRQRKVWDGLAQQLAASGINVLTLDYRGFGESGGVRFDKATPQDAQEARAKRPGDIDLYGLDFERLLMFSGAGGAV